MRAPIYAMRIGTCSWKYPSWAGLVYSAPRNIDYLEEYARKYGSVEIDQWFWSLFREDQVRLPSPGDVRAYRRAVPDRFRFTLKLPNSLSLTHLYRRRPSDPLVPNPHLLSPELYASFAERIAPLADVLGPQILQFEYLNREKLSGAQELFERVGRFRRTLPPEQAFAIELRNPRWIDARYFDFLEEYRLSPVLLEGYWMPPVAEIYRTWRERLRRCPTVIVRLHGEDRKAMEAAAGKRWDRILAPKDAELAAITALVEELAGGGTEVYLNVNNHYEGSAPLTIEKILALLDKKPWPAGD